MVVNIVEESAVERAVALWDEQEGRTSREEAEVQNSLERVVRYIMKVQGAGRGREEATSEE